MSADPANLVGTLQTRAATFRTTVQGRVAALRSGVKLPGTEGLFGQSLGGQLGQLGTGQFAASVRNGTLAQNVRNRVTSLRGTATTGGGLLGGAGILGGTSGILSRFPALGPKREDVDTQQIGRRPATVPSPVASAADVAVLRR